MSIIIHCVGGDRPKIEVLAGRMPNYVTLVFRIGVSYYHMEVPIKELALAIKQVEEERDAKYASDGPDSEGPWIRDHEKCLREAIWKGIEELRRMLRDSGDKSPHDKKFDEVAGSITKARSPKEVEFILERFEKEYLRPDRFPEWR